MTTQHQIWKYNLYTNSEPEIPVGGKVLHVGIQEGAPCLWVLVDPEAEKEHREFMTYGTGHYIRDVHEIDYIGTVDDGAFVWHVYEEMRKVDVGTAVAKMSLSSEYGKLSDPDDKPGRDRMIHSPKARLKFHLEALLDGQMKHDRANDQHFITMLKTLGELTDAN